MFLQWMAIPKEEFAMKKFLKRFGLTLSAVTLLAVASSARQAQQSQQPPTISSVVEREVSGIGLRGVCAGSGRLAGQQQQGDKASGTAAEHDATQARNGPHYSSR